jgi:hypothetical protein
MGTYIVKVTGQFPEDVFGERGADLPRHLVESGAFVDPADPSARDHCDQSQQGQWVIQADDVVMAIGRASAAYKVAAEKSGLDLPMGVRVSVEPVPAERARAIGGSADARMLTSSA